MKYLTIDYIKQHSRIDFDCDDAQLQLYGEAAEEAMLNLLARSYEDIVETFGRVTGDEETDMPVPASIVNGTLLIACYLYENRSIDSQVDSKAVPGLPLLIKPYMRLSGTLGNDQRNRCIATLDQQRQILDYKCATVDIRKDATLADLYGRIATYKNWWSQFDDPAPLIVADMKLQTEQLEKDVKDYLETLNA